MSPRPAFSLAVLAMAALPLVALPVAALAQTTPAAGANPPGTAASRALDRAAGTDTSGAYPSHKRARPRHVQTPRNNSVSRTFDRAAGTNTSGAYPSQADGTPGNPPGTALSRATGTTGATSR